MSYAEGDLVTIDRKPGLWRVVMPLPGMVWLRSVSHPFDTFEFLFSVRRAVRKLQLVGG